MRQTTLPRQQQITPDTARKLSASRKEVSDLSLREIRCPYCDFLVEKVFSDITGHKMVYCRKCKTEYPINLGYFRRMKSKQIAYRPLSKRVRQKR